MEKIIINVGRQIGSGGRDIAKRLAEEFGCKLYDKEILDIAANESGFSSKFFEQSDEHKGFFHHIVQQSGRALAMGSFYNTNQFSEESLFQFQSDAIRKAAEESSCVFVGRCADYVLRDMENVVSRTTYVESLVKAMEETILGNEELTRMAREKSEQNGISFEEQVNADARWIINYQINNGEIVF